MSVHISIDAETAEDARREMAVLLGQPVTEISGAPTIDLPAPGVIPPAQLAETGAARKPGRPRTKPAESETPVAAPSPEPNSGESAPAEAASSSDAATSAGPSSADKPAEETLTFEDVKKLLQDLNAKIGGNAGLEAVSAILAEHGMSKVKELAEHPEHFGAIALKCRAKIAA
ncbi:MAG: hypothetical protein KG075_23820 [Alphaproteobacteria bacterium]|nr:hypothetical protein [Alphaproteobacteria bacterium]